MKTSGPSYVFVITTILCILLQSWVPFTAELDDNEEKYSPKTNSNIWTGENQPWSQFGHNPTRNSTAPIHSTNGGFGLNSLGIITEPSINWKSSADDEYGVQSYGSAIADFSGQISSFESSNERCGSGNLFAVFTIERNSGSENDWLVILEGGLNREAWRVDLGETSDVKSTPGIVDVNGDGIFEIILAYDTPSGLRVDAWSPQLSCSEAGNWNADQHSSELLWTYNEPDLKLGISADSFNAGHLASTQALIADLQLDGNPELVLSTVDDISDRPTIISIPLTNSAPSQPLWQIQLDYGTHPSDPTWAQIDEDNSAILVTTIDSDDGNMWAWRIDSETGSLDWNARSLNSEGDSGVPHIRLPGPVIAQLDDDTIPEVIFTAPGDWDESSPVDAASFHAWELTDGSEILSFTASNGYAETPPIPVDIDNDGIHEHICWVTWFEDGVLNSDRHGRVGCEDITGDSTGWSQDMEPYDGNSNDGIALSQPISVDLNGVGAPEIIVAYGQSLRAFDGDDGNSDVWDDDIDLGKRSWASPSLGDLDGDGLLDILIGDVLVSQANIDIAPILDGRGISFSPSVVDPGDVVEITAQYANHGTISSEEPVDARIYVNNNLISTNRIYDMDPSSPSGNAIDSSFTVDWTAVLGTHEIRLELDPYKNITQSRTDNDNYSIQFTVLEPYDLAISLPPEPTRIDPGDSEILDISISAIGRRAAEWSMNLNTSNMPENWSVVDQNPELSQSVYIDPEGSEWTPNLLVSIPESAEGSEAGSFLITMTLDSNPDISKNFLIPIEVNLTRGLSITGPDGNSISTGHGLREENASAWFQIENLGNAEERLTSQTWSSNIWQTTPFIFDENGGPYYSITLAPGEVREFVAIVEVPKSAELGSIASNTFTACIGTEDDSLCKSIEFTFIANSISMLPPHVKSIPGVDLSWKLNSNSSEGDLIVDLAASGMALPGWVWSAEGHGTLDGNILNISQTNNIETTWINASIPNQSPPLLHVINSEISLGISLNFSVNILQVNRAEIEIVDPTDEPVIVDVNSINTLIVKLKNKGNGEDSFKLNAEFIDTGDVKDDPGIEFFIPVSSFSLNVDTSVFPTIDYTIPENSPAGETITIRISITSSVDPNLYEFEDILISAKQHHNWSVSNISGTEFDANQNENVYITFNITNTGNLVDLMQWSSTIETIQNSNDTSNWNVQIDPERALEVNQSSLFGINVTIPDSAWENSILFYNLSLISDSKSFIDLNFKINVLRNSGWALKLINSELDVESTGSNITIEIENKGNSIVEPILIPVLPTGWNLTNISETFTVEPGKTISATLHIIPPSNSMAGEIGMMTLIAKDGDTLNGRSEIAVPLRVANIYSMEIGFEEEWYVSEKGGYPLVWIKNTGNGLSKISLETNTPEGWQTTSTNEFYIPSGATKGLPISLIPPENWNGDNFSQTIRIWDPSGFEQNITLNVKTHCCNLDLSWGASPVFVGYANDAIEIKINGDTNSEYSIIELNNPGIFEYDVCTNLNLNDCNNELKYKVIILEKPILNANCDLENSVISKLELGENINSETIASCELSETINDIRWNILLRINGVLVESISGIQSGNSTTQNLTLDGWAKSSGIHLINIEIYDGFGKLLDSDARRIVIPYKNWNIGISSVDLSSDNEDLTINMRRENYEQLSDVYCVLSGSSSSEWSAEWKIDMAKGQLAPTITITRPNITSNEIEFKLNCEEPWHLDDDLEDNTFTFMVPNISTPIIESNDWAWTIISAIILLAIAKMLGLLELNQKKPERRNSERTTNKENQIKFIQNYKEKDAEEENSIFIEDEKDKLIEEVVEEEEEEVVEEEEEEVVEVTQVEEIKSEIEDDIDAKINKMMSRERYYN